MSHLNQGAEGKMFGIGMPEFIIILVIVLIIFGAGKLPEIGGGIGKAIRNFKDATKNQPEEDTSARRIESEPAKKVEQKTSEDNKQ
jgi:sec-independent protein translocase protein TatA